MQSTSNAIRTKSFGSSRETVRHLEKQLAVCAGSVATQNRRKRLAKRESAEISRRVEWRRRWQQRQQHTCDTSVISSGGNSGGKGLAGWSIRLVVVEKHSQQGVRASWVRKRLDALGGGGKPEAQARAAPAALSTRSQQDLRKDRCRAERRRGDRCAAEEGTPQSRRRWPTHGASPSCQGSRDKLLAGIGKNGLK